MHIHIIHTGSICVSPSLLFGKTRSERIWLPVSTYFIEYGDKKIVVDTGWHRDMSPEGVFDRKAQIRSLGSRLLYKVHQGIVPKGATLKEQLRARGIEAEDLDAILLTHLDCDHANGLKQLAKAKRVYVAAEELDYVKRNGCIRYRKQWWDGVDMTPYDWNGTEGPAGKSCDLYGDGAITIINIPGHSDGLCAVRLCGCDGKFVLLVADGAYTARGYEELIVPDIVPDRKRYLQSLTWIRDQSRKPSCLAVFTSHDPDVLPQTIVL